MLSVEELESHPSEDICKECWVALIEDRLAAGNNRVNS
jgi:hypothetical protein